MKWLKHVDIFGSTFTFTIFGQSKHQTRIGGILSICFLALVIAFILLFGKDFFFRTNPQVLSYNEHPIENNKTILTNDSLVLPWTIVDLMGNEVKFEGLIYPMIYYWRYEKDPITNELYIANRLSLGYDRCNASFFEQKFDFNISNYYCSNLNNVTMGGSLDGDFFDYISIYISYCPNGAPFSSQGNCTPLDYYERMVGDGLMFKIKYPELSFQPNNIDNPMQISYSSYSVIININLQKDDYLFFHKAKLIDDQTLIFEDRKNVSAYSLVKHSQDFNYFSNNFLETEGTMSDFYFCTIYLEKEIMIYHRSYMKLQNLIALIGGFIQLIMICFEVVPLFINNGLKEFDLITSFFNFNSSELLPYSFTKAKVISMNNITNLNNSINNDPNASKVDLAKLNRTNLDIPSYPINKKTISIDKDLRPIIQNIKQSKPSNNNNKVTIFFCMKYYCLRMNGKYKKKSIYNDYAQAVSILSGRLDIFFYLNLIKECGLLKNLFLSKEQVDAMNYLKTPNIQNNSDMKVFFNQTNNQDEITKVKDMIQYFNNSKSSTMINELDCFIVDYLHPQIKKYID